MSHDVMFNLLKETRSLPLSWTEVKLSYLQHNLKIIKALANRSRFSFQNGRQAVTNQVGLMPVLKAEAYGHGMVEVARSLPEDDVTWIAVSDLQEGVILRREGIALPVVLLEPILPEAVEDVLKFELIPTVMNLDVAEKLNALAKAQGTRCSLHVEVDTGMSRLGVWHEKAFDFVSSLQQFTHLDIEGLFTHFPVADSNPAFTSYQIKLFRQLAARLDESGLVIPYLHAANSMGVCEYVTDIFNIVRPGLMLYGVAPRNDLQQGLDLLPVMSVKSRVLRVDQVPAGRGISYGHKFISDQPMTIATVAIGYHDGYLRAMSYKASIIVGGVRCPVVGTVTMDQIMVDVSAVPVVEDGMTVTILGEEGEAEISAHEMADWAGTIPYEILCQFGLRLPRVSQGF